MITKNYLAGFVDGEGSIAIYKHKDSRVQKGYTLHPKFVIANTNEEVLKAIKEIIGGKIKALPKHKGCKIVYCVEFQDYAQIEKALRIIKPFLIIKQKQADLMIEFCNNRIESNGKKYSDRDYEIANIFSTINTRGERSDKLLGILPTIL
jgi:hypothetical protein